MSQRPRSYLYVPGHRPALLAGAHRRGADALILDLEDAVPLTDKQGALAAARSWLMSAPSSKQTWVRVNPAMRIEGEIASLLSLEVSSLAGLILPKVQAAEDVAPASALIAEMRPMTKLACLLESAAGLEAMREIAAAPGVSRLQLGEADLRASLGIPFGAGDEGLLAARLAIIQVSAAYELEAPTASTSRDYRNPEALRMETERLRDMGFVGRACIHPDQVKIVNEVFTPSPEDLKRAKEILALAGTADVECEVDAGMGGTGAAPAESGARVGPDGTMMDDAVVAAARRFLADYG